MYTPSTHTQTHTHSFFHISLNPVFSHFFKSMDEMLEAFKPEPQQELNWRGLDFFFQFS